MCGIVGAASHQNIVDVLVEGLRRLEYRGYDSCGFAVINGNDAKHPIERARTTARVSELSEQGKDFFGQCQTQTIAFDFFVVFTAIESFENFVAVIVGNTTAIITHRKNQPLAAFG